MKTYAVEDDPFDNNALRHIIENDADLLPMMVTFRGRPVAVLMSYTDYEMSELHTGPARDS